MKCVKTMYYWSDGRYILCIFTIAKICYSYLIKFKRFFMYRVCFISKFMHVHILVLLSVLFLSFLIILAMVHNCFCLVNSHFRHIFSFPPTWAARNNEKHYRHLHFVFSFVYIAFSTLVIWFCFWWICCFFLGLNPQ